MQTDAINNIIIDDFNSEMDSYLHGTSLAKPLKCAGFKNNYLYINHDFYKKNKEIIQNMILGIINNSKEDSFTFLNAELLNEDVIADLLAKIGFGAANAGTQGCIVLIMDEPKMPKSLLNK